MWGFTSWKDLVYACRRARQHQGADPTRGTYCLPRGLKHQSIHRRRLWNTLDEGVQQWTDPISTYLPEFNTAHDLEIGRRATLFDLCSHGAGLAPLDCTGTGVFDEF
jgi:hypothetical protein